MRMAKQMPSRKPSSHLVIVRVEVRVRVRVRDRVIDFLPESQSPIS